jgi:hypothetical protein
VPEQVINNVMTGGHPSAYSDYLKPLHDKHVIAINNAYRIGNWIDAVFFGDCAWYVTHRLGLAQFPGLRVSCCDRFINKSEGHIRYLAKDKSKTQGISENPTTVAWNGNSGAAAISFAYHLGVKRIVLLGFDMVLDSKRKSHWHGSHVPNATKPKSPPFARHLRGFPLIAEDAKRLGLEILNASSISVIDVFPKVKVRDLLWHTTTSTSEQVQSLSSAM